MTKPNETTNTLGWTKPFNVPHALEYFISGNDKTTLFNPQGGKHYVHVVGVENPEAGTSYVFLSLSMWADNADHVYKILQEALNKRIADSAQYTSAGFHGRKYGLLQQALSERLLFITPVGKEDILNMDWCTGTL